MSIFCFAENPGGANGIITFALANKNVEIHAEGSAIKYIEDHELRTYSSGKIPNSTKAVIVGASHSKDSGSFKYILYAREKGIPSFGYVDACVNTDIRFKGRTNNSLYYAPDYLFVTEESTALAYTDIGFNPENIFIVGNPRYDFVVERTKNYVRKESKKKKLLFLADPLLPNVGSDYKNSGFDANSSEDVRSYILLDSLIKNYKDMDITIKLHPRNNSKEFLSYKNNCSIYEGSELGIDLAFQADLVVGTTTSLLAESAIIGTPTVSALLTKQERNWLPNVLPDSLRISVDEDHFKESIKTVVNSDYKRIFPSNQNTLCRNSGVKMLEIINNHCLQ